MNPVGIPDISGPVKWFNDFINNATNWPYFMIVLLLGILLLYGLSESILSQSKWGKSR